MSKNARPDLSLWWMMIKVKWLRSKVIWTILKVPISVYRIIPTMNIKTLAAAFKDMDHITIKVDCYWFKNWWNLFSFQLNLHGAVSAIQKGTNMVVMVMFKDDQTWHKEKKFHLVLLNSMCGSIWRCLMHVWLHLAVFNACVAPSL